jgi:positive regulator of sigma E activity
MIAMLRYSVGLLIMIAALCILESLGIPTSAAAVGGAVGFATIFWLHRRKQTVG